MMLPEPLNLDCTRFDSFTARVDWTDDHTACWEWLGAKTGAGYGSFGRSASAHRIAWELERGPIAPGLDIDHLCRNRACVNPAHMEAVTRRTNVLRGVGPTAAHARKSACANGHEFTEANTLRVATRPSARICRTCKNARDRAYRTKVRAARCSRCCNFGDDGLPAGCICAQVFGPPHGAILDGYGCLCRACNTSA